jgi:hypothetical protein
VLPCVLANAPSQVIRMMNTIWALMKCKFIIVYLDDTLLHGRTLEEHVVHVCSVFPLHTEHGLKGAGAKCACACQKVDFCGFDIDKDCIHPQEHKPHVVLDWPQPENCKDIRGFQGLTSYYRIFIEHYVQVAMPLYASGTLQKATGDFGR